MVKWNPSGAPRRLEAGHGVLAVIPWADLFEQVEQAHPGPIAPVATQLLAHQPLAPVLLVELGVTIVLERGGSATRTISAP